MTFMKTFWAALLAFIAANMVALVLLAMVLASFAAFFGETTPLVRKNTIIHIEISDGISDSPSSAPFSYSGFRGVRIDRSNTILQAVSAIEMAAGDSNVAGIYINLAGGAISLANIEELRAALTAFRDSGKFIISYSDSYSQLGYYLSSVADKVFLNPQGGIMWNGLASSVMFYKGMLDKLGIEPEILRHGSFKAAVEPFMYDRMSQENREQLNTMLSTIWSTILHDVSMSRGIDSAVLSNYATEISLRSASHAVEYGFADALLYKDQVMELLEKLSAGYGTMDEALASVLGTRSADYDETYTEGLDEDSIREERAEGSEWVEQPGAVTVNAEETYASTGEPVLMTLGDYILAREASGRSMSKNRIALIYADGDIVDGPGGQGSVGGATLSGKIADARRDESVKAIVLRVNSPGGSALASEVVWREMSLAKKVKPVIVSMGGVAASGGYYISCPADLIISGRTTLTGSIGVFGILADISRGMRDKLGITVDVVRTNPSADAGSLFRRLSPNEREAFMAGIEEVYSTFVRHVAEGRNMSVESVDQIAGGRVWSGVSAAGIGLVDGFGGIKDAVTIAADRAGISGDYRVWQITDAPDNLTMLLRSLGGIKAYGTRDDLAEMFAHYNALRNMLSQRKGVQARMPYVLDIQ